MRIIRSIILDLKMVEISTLNLKIKVSLRIIVEEKLLKNVFKEVSVRLIQLLEKEQRLLQMQDAENTRMVEY